MVLKNEQVCAIARVNVREKESYISVFKRLALLIHLLECRFQISPQLLNHYKGKLKTINK